MNEKQTAIEWLVEKLKEQEYLGVFCTPDAWGREEEIMKGIVEQAKEMEKQQIKEAFEEGKDIEYEYHINDEPRIGAEEYYKETFNK
jgi:predicted secreted protein